MPITAHAYTFLFCYANSKLSIRYLRRFASEEELSILYAWNLGDIPEEYPRAVPKPLIMGRKLATDFVLRYVRSFAKLFFIFLTF